MVAVTALILGWMYLDRRDGGMPGGEGEEVGFFAKWNPFGSGSAPAPGQPGGEEPGSGEETLPENIDLRLMKVSTMPVAGFGLFQKERVVTPPLTPPSEGGEESSPPNIGGVPEGGGGRATPPKTEFVSAVRYVERAKGLVYQSFADKVKEGKFSSTVIPKVYEAYFGNDARLVAMRYLKSNDETIETFLGTLPEEFAGEEAKDDHEIKGTFLPANTTDVSISGDSKKMFYLFNLGDGAVGTVLDFTNNKRIQSLETPFTEWLSFFPNNKMILLNTKPAAGIMGYLYKLDLGTKNLTKLLGGINGLTTLSSPSGELILYTDNTLNLYVYNVSTRETKSLNARTLPEKCVWPRTEEHVYCALPIEIPPAPYPDNWYQGEVTFSDDIWKIDISSATKKLSVSPASEIRGEEIDAIKLDLDEKEEYLFFINKKDSYLWRLELK